MDILDDIVAIKKLDKNHTASSIKHIPDQCKQAWEETQKLVFPENFSNIKNILVAGMGGSAYGIRIVKSLYDKERLMDVPIELANNYWLPGYTGPNSLVIPDLRKRLYPRPNRRKEWRQKFPASLPEGRSEVF